MAFFITDNFLLQNGVAEKLYHGFASELPIIDYHSHLSPRDMADDRQFESITQIWLKGDHYKWRAMRALGIEETYITGDATDRDKFRKWAEAVPHTVRNPLYHWTHLELKRYFDVDLLLSPENADDIFDHCNHLLSQDGYSSLGLLNKMNVELVCTSDDPTHSLEHHTSIATSPGDPAVLPTFRPDPVYKFSNPGDWNRYIDRLAKAADTEINSLENLCAALEDRIDYFSNAGCMLADHGLAKLPGNPEKADPYKAFDTIRGGSPISKSESDALTFHLLITLGRLYRERDWAQQFHLGAFRNTNTRKFNELGADTGFDSIGDYRQGPGLWKLLDTLDKTDDLARTILYNLNPADNSLFATMAGNFNDGSVRGKVQYGPAWWFLDQKDGIKEQLTTLSNLGLLSCFIGMLTDSRSLLSYTRHEYFRRVLCNIIGTDVENGELPKDLDWLGEIVSDICYHNAKQYFNL